MGVMSVFESVTRSLVQELDSGGDMIPVKSMVDAGAFKCCYLVRGRKRFWGWAYYKTDLTLEDILDEKDEGLFGSLLAGFRGQYVAGLYLGGLRGRPASPTSSSNHEQQQNQPTQRWASDECYIRRLESMQMGSFPWPPHATPAPASLATSLHPRTSFP
ncbi:hypothetical protein U0070_023533 [Myodes glareolus]|uniref:Gasdermin pore forming domain-containing protein n=1 Tax=Myodes glareolus TaxID=447135 RepID=A0AAW0HMB7_MYOGA